MVGRDGLGATVVIDTAAIPDWFPIHDTASVDTWSAGEQVVLTATRELLSESDRDGMTTAAVADHEAVGVTARRVRAILRSFSDAGYLDHAQASTDGRASYWIDDGLTALGEHGTVALPTAVADDADVAEEPRIHLYTRNFRNRSVDAGVSGDVSRQPSKFDPSTVPESLVDTTNPPD